MLRRSILAVGVLLLAGVSLAAQPGEPISYLAEFQVKPEKAEDFVALVKKYDKPLLDRLQKEGTVLAWGLDATMIHREGGPTHMFWFVMPNYAAMDKVFAGFEEAEKAMPAEDQQKLMATVDLTKHHDHIVRSIIININEQASAKQPYTSYAFVKVQPGKGSEWRELFEKYNKPVLDKLVADGSIIGYGVDVEDFHTDDPSWRAIWVVTADLAGIDKLDAAFEADRNARPERERQTVRLQFREVTVPEAHRDALWRTLVLGGE